MRRRSLSKCYEYTADVVRQQMAEFDMQESLIQPYAGGHASIGSWAILYPRALFR